MEVPIPRRVQSACRTADQRAWLAQAPARVRDLAARWSLTIEAPFDGDEVSCAWVAPATRRDGRRVVLKLGMPHFEAEDERTGLRFWNGDPTVRLLDTDDESGAMVLERCEPGAHLRARPASEQDAVIAGLLGRLWRTPPSPNPFRPLSALTHAWADETDAQRDRWPDAGLVGEGLRLLRALATDDAPAFVLATDLHAGNVLQAERESWLVIDPKPFAGDRAYDATQHLLNDLTRLQDDPAGGVSRFADRLEIDAARVRLWLFARLAADPRDDWRDGALDLARRLAP